MILGGKAGSSPHTWRILNAIVKADKIGRIISTYVENTVFIGIENKTAKDHLHIRGEYLCFQITQH